MLTCKRFLDELNDYLDETLDPETRAQLQKHVDACPNCWVLWNTTDKTLKVFKGMEPQPVPPGIQARLMEALEKKCKAKKVARERTDALSHQAPGQRFP